AMEARACRRVRGAGSGLLPMEALLHIDALLTASPSPFGRHLPLLFGGKTSSGPRAERPCLAERDTVNRVGIPSYDEEVAPWLLPFRGATSTGLEAPPVGSNRRLRTVDDEGRQLDLLVGEAIKMRARPTLDGAADCPDAVFACGN